MSVSQMLIDNGIPSGPWFKECLKIMDETKSIEKAVTYYESVKPVLIDLEDGLNKEINIFCEQESDSFKDVLNTIQSYLNTPYTIKADIHADCSPTGAMPVGTCIYSNKIHPELASSDLHCSVHATYFVSKSSQDDIMESIVKNSHFGSNVSGNKNKFVPNQLIEMICKGREFKFNKNDLIKHFATSGDGNHFINLCKSSRCENEWVIVTHFGSRGPGANFQKQAYKYAQKNSLEVCEDLIKDCSWLNNSLEREYIEKLEFLKSWTKESHAQLIFNILNDFEDINIKRVVSSYHNTINKINDEYLHLKGSTLFTPNSFGVIPFNYDKGIYVFKNTSNKYLTAPHGAGRDISRTKFKNNIENYQNHFDKMTQNVDFRFWSGRMDVSEMADAYKNPDEVLNAINKFIPKLEVRDILKPVGVVMAGEFKRKWKKK